MQMKESWHDTTRMELNKNEKFVSRDIFKLEKIKLFVLRYKPFNL
jgi:hypothetical protein